MTGGSGRRAGRSGGAATAVLAAGAALAAYRFLRKRPPGGEVIWVRTNHRGEKLTLLEGPAVAAGAVAAAVLAPAMPARTRVALATAGLGAAAFGAYDDLAGNGDRRGFRGHLGALAHGEVTTGAVKMGGIGATGLMTAALIGGPAVDVAINAALTAGTANLLNLFDLRPGRAIKAAAMGGALLSVVAPGSEVPRHVTEAQSGPVAGGAAGRGPARRPRPAGAQAAAAPLGAALALLPEDLGERSMLGDAGANALGAMLGAAAGASASRPVRLALLAGVIGLTAASEKVSFTAVIERTPALRWLDMLGRRPPEATPDR